MRFETVGIVSKIGSDEVWATLDQLISILKASDRTVFIDEESSKGYPNLDTNMVRDRDSMAEAVDLIIVVGGDGTLLNIAREVVDHHKPILGVNLGRLGFLTDVSPEDMDQVLVNILDGDYKEDKRMMLKVTVIRDQKVVYGDMAFNDVVIHKSDVSRIIEFETYIDRHFVFSQRSDGLIVSTPTGSTAYALSAGGPILYPDLNAITLVSVCPHTMSNRPIVIRGNSIIEITGNNVCRGEAQVSCDGQNNFKLENDDRIRIRRYGEFVRLIHPNCYDHYDRLRAKLRWGEKF